MSNGELALTITQSLKNGFKTKAFHFYGRSARSEFWPFYIASYLSLCLASVLYFVPVVGQLGYAIVFMLILISQLSATVRRLHDLDNNGKIVAIPYLLLLCFFIARFPVYALLPQMAEMILNILITLVVLSFIYILYLCTKAGTLGDNRYGTDPLSLTTVAQDFINPKHMQAPELKGDPWRNYKRKTEPKVPDETAIETKVETKTNSSEQQNFQEVLLTQHQKQVDQIKQKALSEGLDITDSDIEEFIKQKKQQKLSTKDTN